MEILLQKKKTNKQTKITKNTSINILKGNKTQKRIVHDHFSVCLQKHEIILSLPYISMTFSNLF